MVEVPVGLFRLVKKSQVCKAFLNSRQAVVLGCPGAGETEMRRGGFTFTKHQHNFTFEVVLEAV